MSAHFDHGAGLRAGAPSGLGNMPRLTQSSYRDAVSETVSGLAAAGHGLTDQDMAELLGTSAATVGNARNKKGDLSARGLLAIGKAFQPAALNTILALIGAKAVPVESVCSDVGALPVKIAQSLPLLITLLSDGQCCDSDVRALERAGIIDEIIAAASYLEARRNEVRMAAGSI